jgi:hypothetical protein
MAIQAFNKDKLLFKWKKLLESVTHGGKNKKPIHHVFESVVASFSYWYIVNR